MADKKKVLLIDDEKDFGFFLKKNLEETGEFQVVTATRGEEGIDLAREKKPDLILLDVIMPEISGNEVAETLSNDFRTNQIPIIFLTAIVTKEEAEMGAGPVRKIGGQNFIAKTVGTEKIISSIRKVLGKDIKE